MFRSKERQSESRQSGLCWGSGRFSGGLAVGEGENVVRVSVVTLKRRPSPQPLLDSLVLRGADGQARLTFPTAFLRVLRVYVCESAGS